MRLLLAQQISGRIILSCVTQSFVFDALYYILFVSRKASDSLFTASYAESEMRAAVNKAKKKSEVEKEITCEEDDKMKIE